MDKSDEWQPKCLKINQRGKFLLESGQWADCNFLVGTEQGEQKQFKCHKLLLSMASPVFEAMFYGSIVECTNPIEVPDVQPDAFKLLLDYMYTDEVNMTSCVNICELWYAAKKYMLPHLASKCISYLNINVKPVNACSIYEYADLFEEPALVNKCLDIMKTRTKEVVTNKTFVETKLNTVVTLFSMDKLDITNELDLFDAAVRYHQAQQFDSSGFGDNINIKRRYIEATAEKASENVNKDKFNIRSVIEKIRFLTLTAEQFASGPANSNLLTDSESYAIIMNIATTTSKMPVPEGFSRSRVLRNRYQYL